MPPSLLQLPLEIREKILYHTFFPVLPRDKSTTSPFPATKIYPNIQPTEDPETNYPTTLPLSILRTSHQLLREGELLLYRHLELNLIYRDRKADSRYGGLQSAIMFVERLNPRHRQLVRYLELKCLEIDGEVPSLSEWMYGLYFLEIEFHSLRELRFWCPVGVERRVLERFRGEREWVRKVLRVTVFGGEEGVEEVV